MRTYAILAALLIAANAWPETVAQAYIDLQARLNAARSVTFVTDPTTGNAWDHESDYGFMRPNKAYLAGYGQYSRTDGQRTSLNEPGINRKAAPGDLSLFRVPGFESFYDPEKRIKVEAKGDVREFMDLGHKFLALDLKLDGRPVVLYLDPQTRLPAGCSWEVRGSKGILEPESVNPAYGKVELDAKIDPTYFKVFAPKPAQEVLEVWVKRLRHVAELSIAATVHDDTVSRLGRSNENQLIAAQKPGFYKREGPQGKVISDGKTVYSEGPEGKRWTIAPRKKLPEPLPGFETFFDTSANAKTSGLAEIAFFRGGGGPESYAVPLKRPAKGRDLTVVYIEVRTGKPVGYEVSRGGKVWKVVEYQLQNFEGSRFFSASDFAVPKKGR